MRDEKSGSNLEGWDTSLSTPFTVVAELPVLFARPHDQRHFSARLGSATFWIEVQCMGKFWLHSRNEETREVRKHHFQTCPGLSNHRIGRAILALTSEIHDYTITGATSLDLRSFKETFASVQSINSLSDGQPVSLTTAQSQSLEYIVRCLGLSGYVMIHSGEEFFASDGSSTIELGQTLPSPLDLFPSIEVHIDEGNLHDFREGEVWEGEVHSPYSVIDRMKALIALGRGGIPPEMINELEDYVNELIAVEST